MRNDAKKSAGKDIYFPYDALVNSKRYEEDNWAARAALRKDRRYTLEGADKAISDFKGKPAKGGM